jgi:hypothetical protein
LKYIVSGKQVIYPEDYETKVDFLRKSQKWLDTKMTDGVVECAYSYPAGGGFLIFNASSHEELVAELIDFPLYPLSEFKVEPLLTFNQNAELVIGEFKKIGVYKDA